MEVRELPAVDEPKGLREKVARSKFGQLSPFIRKFIVGVIGGTVVLIGVAMMVLPGPAFIVIPIGLGILATEFVWARHVVNKGKSVFERLKRKVKSQ